MVGFLPRACSYGIRLSTLGLLGLPLALAHPALAMVHAATPYYTPNLLQTATVSGVVFDDVNYGGGAGRDYATANASANASGFASGAIGRSGAKVEFYDNTGAYIGSTTTGTNGVYSYALPAAGTYTVRVVNSTVTSARTASTAGSLAVQTYNGTTDRVGGENPQAVDAAANNGSQTLGSLSSTGVMPQSICSITVTDAGLTGVNFGFNFDLIVNTNNSGQGSLRQFITNANNLANTNLNQEAASSGGSDPAAGVETSLFMISDGAAHPGLRSGLPNQLTNGVAVIAPTSVLPASSDTYTTLDGTTQTQNVGNTNNTTLGTGGTVGTTNTPLGQLNGPEVQLVGQSNIGPGLDFSGAYNTLKGLAVYGFGNIGNNNTQANVRVTGANSTVTQNVLGATATSFTNPNTSASGDNLYVLGGANYVTVSNNLIGFSKGKGINVSNTPTNGLYTGNEIRSNASSSYTMDGIDLVGINNTVSYNLLTGNNGQGIDSYRSRGSNTYIGNTITANGLGGFGSPTAETPGIRIYGANNVVKQNVIADNYGAGIMLEGQLDAATYAFAKTTVISQNSIYNNGNSSRPDAANTQTGQIGIDLEVYGESETQGNSPYVTKNNTIDATTTAKSANGLVNYPVITSANLINDNLVLKGYAKAGAIIELFVAQANPVSVNATGAYFGQGKTYLGTYTEGSSSDTDGSTGQSYSGAINGFDQGSDTNANGFTFTIPVSSLKTSVSVNDLLTSTATIANATSEFSGNVRVLSPPVPRDGTNSTIDSNLSTATPLDPSISASVYGSTANVTTSTTNTISYYTIKTLPTSGVLYYNGVAITSANTQITDPSKLSYLPARGSNTSATFTYTATDANGLESTQHDNGISNTVGSATYTLVVRPLPVQLVAFTVQSAQSHNALLKWMTASELHNDHFDVERSYDGTNFVKIGQVRGQGSTAAASNYAFTDTGLGQQANARVYYRLKQVDTDGSSSFSPVRTLTLAKAALGLVTAYPNPTTATTTFDLTQLPAGTYQGQLLDATGQLLRQFSLVGGQTQVLDLSNLPNGLYLMQLSGNSAEGAAQRPALRIVKQ